MSILLHGTTMDRADEILIHGPDPNYVEPGGGPPAENFSTYLETGPFLLGSPTEYARLKALAFPGEGGPAILAVDVPDDIITLAVDAVFPLDQGIIQFDWGAGLEELCDAWPSLTKNIMTVSVP